MKTSVVVISLLAVVLSSCGFTRTCPTYTKKTAPKGAPTVVRETRI